MGCSVGESNVSVSKGTSFLARVPRCRHSGFYPSSSALGPVQFSFTSKMMALVMIIVYELLL